MGLQEIIPLLAAIAYMPLLIILLFNRPWRKQNTLFALYLTAAMTWGLSTLLLRSETLLEHKLVLFRINIFCFVWVTVQYYYFLRFYLHQSGGGIMRFGYAMLALIAIAAILGYLPEDVTFQAGVVSPSSGWWIILVAIPLSVILATILYLLIRRLRVSTDPIERNRIVYLLAGIGIVSALVLASIPPLGDTFPFAHIGHLINACVLTYTTLRYQLLDTRLIVRRALTYISLIGILLFIFTSWLVLLFYGFRILLNIGSVIGVAVLTALTAVTFWSRARAYFYQKTEELFYGKSYDDRQELSDFLRNKIRGVFSLRELSEGLLTPLVKVVGCRQAHMLISESASGDFVAEFSEPTPAPKTVLRIKKNSPIAEWLKRENRYLTRETLDIHPEFRGLWEEELDRATSLDIELLFPVVSRDNLIGILALSRKKTGKYSLEDTNFVENIASQVAISLEKEYLQEELRKSEEELSLINRLALVITSSLNIQEIYDAFVSGLRKVLSVDFATVALVEGTEICFSALSSQMGSAWKVGEKIHLKGTATEWVIRQKKSLMEPDLERDSIFTTGEEYLKRGIRSIVYLPLITKDEGIGSLIIGSRLPHAYTPTQVNLLERLASQISTSIANSQLYARAEQKSRIDELTGLYNRRHFDETLKHEIDRHSRYGSMLSLAFIDLDNFKRYNDTLGHLAGDKLLAQVGHLLQASVRNIDMAFRYGGDEFAIIMPHTSSENCYTVAERVRGIITAEIASNQISVTTSFGLASWPSDGLTTDHLINAADKALYHAKHTGGNRTCVVSQMLPLATEIHEKTPAAEKETLNIIYALASTIEARDTYTYGHSQKVRAYAVALAESLGLPPEKVVAISHAALLHDIGKIGIYDDVLNKSEKLDVAEFEIVKAHPELSRAIVAHVSSLTPCLQAIHQHHERWDGKGYPSGLKGEALSLEGRILAIADAFDAMTSKRPYRAPMSSKDAVQELKHGAGTQFDPNLVEAFIPIALSTTPEELVIRHNPGRTDID